MNLPPKNLFGRSRYLAIATSLILTTSCSSALADTNETWRCDVPSGKLDYRTAPILKNTRIIQGSIKVNKADFSTEWASEGKILFSDSSENTECHCNGITIFSFPNSDSIDLDVMINGESVAIAQTKFTKTVDFKIEVTSDGTMTVEMGEYPPVVKTVKLLHPEHDTVGMSCSGMDISFSNIQMN